ncbi:MAG: peptidylprolyl isomerase [Nitrospinota bacterium]|nr:peptidylprolyl isomerase [Nitrospinota bacterium]
MDRKPEERDQSKGGYPGHIASRTLALYLLASLWASPMASAEIVDRIVANVNGSIILLSEVEGKLATLRELKYRQGVDIPEESLTERKVLSEMIDEKLITSYAKEKEISIKESEVDLAVQNIKERNNLSDEDFDQAMKAQGTSLEKFREELKNQILVQRVMKLEVDIVTPTENDAKSYYERHAEEFMGEGRVRARHILIKIPAEGEEAAKQKILSIREKIKSGASFADMAKEYSNDPSGPTGGELGWFHMGDVVQAFGKAAFALKPGMMSQPVRTGFGYHLIQVLEKEKLEPVAFAQVAEKIKEKLTQQAFVSNRTEWLARMRSEAFIEIMF